MDKDLGLRAHEFFHARIREQAPADAIQSELRQYAGPALACDRLSSYCAAPGARDTIAKKRYFGTYMHVDIKNAFVEGFVAKRDGRQLDWLVCGGLFPGDVVSLKSGRIEESDLGLWLSEKTEYFAENEGRFEFELRRAYWHETEPPTNSDDDETPVPVFVERFVPLGHYSTIASDPFTAFHTLSAKRKANWGQLLKVDP